MQNNTKLSQRPAVAHFVRLRHARTFTDALLCH